jgi:CRP-like cAMP-binding protein
VTANTSRPLSPEDAAQVTRADVFRELPAEAVAELTRLARVVSLKKGQALFWQDDPAASVFLLLRGRLKVSATSADGYAVVLRLEGPGAPLGLLAALGETRYPVTAEAMEPCAIARWQGAQWQALLQRHPRVALTLLPTVLARLRAAQDQCRELATERVERRVARVVLRLVRQAGNRTSEGVLVDAALTRQELAEMAGTTLFTVSRLLSQWAADGLLVTRGRRLLIKVPHALVRIAEDLPSGAD